MKLLFICTHNRCRSVLAEAVTNYYGNGRLIARSAGSQPAGEVHPLTLKYLAEAGVPIDGLSSQSWDAHESWNPDVVITVCDSAAGEQCPLWFGKALKVHWGLPDPSSLKAGPEETAEAFRATINTLRERIETLLANNLEQLQPMEVAQVFERLGEK
ncbi:MAG: arsenate reductase ArsC [Pseudomonadales bacterium]|nr:arsenate reductase ArsC [Pseudomonadales bacterium]